MDAPRPQRRRTRSAARELGADPSKIRNWHAMAAGAAMAVVAAGIGGALALYFVLHSNQLGTFDAAFDSECRQSIRLIDVAFNRRIAGTLQRVGAFLYAVPSINQDLLDQFCRASSFDTSIVYAVSVTPVLGLNQVAQYPRTLTPVIRGFDQLSEPVRRSTLRPLLESATRNMAISNPIWLLYNASGFVAWTKAPNRTETTDDTPFVQWIGGITLFTADLLNTTLGMDQRHKGVHMTIFHASGERLYSTLTPANEKRIMTTLDYQFAVFDQQWRATCLATRSYRRGFLSSAPIVIAVITVIMGLAAAELTRRIMFKKWVAKYVDERLRSQVRLLHSLASSAKAVVDSMPDGLMVVNAHGRILALNDAALTMTGYSVAELERIPVTVIVAPTPATESETDTESTSHESAVPAETTRPQTDVEPLISLPPPPPPTTATPNSYSRPPPPPNPRPFPMGEFDGTVLRRDHTTVAVKVFVHAATDDPHMTLDARALFPNGENAGFSLLPNVSQRDAITQIILLHVISDEEVQTRAAVAKAQRDKQRAHASKLSLLQILTSSLFPRVMTILRTLGWLQRRTEVTEQAAASSRVVAPPARTRVGTAYAHPVPQSRGLMGPTLHSVPHPALPSTAPAVAHMVEFMEDLALYVGSPLPAEYAVGAGTVSVQRILRDQLDRVAPVTAAKRLRVLATVDPPDLVLRGDSAVLRLIIAKIVALGSRIARRGATWTIRHALISAGTDAPPDIAAAPPHGRARSVDSPAPAAPRPAADAFPSGRMPSSTTRVSTNGARQRRSRRATALSAPLEDPLAATAHAAAEPMLEFTHSLTAVDQWLDLHDLEQVLTQQARHDDVCTAGLTYLGIEQLVDRLGGTFRRGVDSATGVQYLSLRIAVAALGFEVVRRDEDGEEERPGLAHGA
ncbi:PAS domain S-box protein [Allomyces macrogynus ATCC 38327]|uniref:PAS domain S-box protein n=1 Tax=Allomyces macrogynus (strain ATCC 38327) TaxID=578462 RepID=A0A0L0S3P0_ALLM3|nr:PAS domain S-box protein [Allomyces macrogynus ATCC 38327]|eukprot:KNE57172.1 PAS domain S-box protein [Allomyces macrogynus ATCC 38327]